MNETIRAVAIIQQEIEREHKEKDTETVIGDAALEVVELNIITIEIDWIIDSVIEEEI